MSRRVAAV